MITQSLAAIQAQLISPTVNSPTQPHSSSGFAPLRQLKVDFPKFNGGNDVLHWLYRAERFFKIYDVPEDQMLDVIAVNLEGRALAWFQLWEKLNQVRNWMNLSIAIQIQFGPSQFDNPREELLKLKQTSSVDKYFESFNDLASRTYGMDDTLLLDCFTGGLHPELKREVKARSPASLLQGVSLAKLFEERFFLSSSRWKSSYPPPQHTVPKPSPGSNPMTLSPNPTSPLLPTPTSSTKLRKLSPTEIQFRREKGLCFTCDERFSPSHKCATKHYFLIQTTEAIPEDPPIKEENTEIKQPDDFGEHIPEDSHHLSYNALTGIPAKRSIRFTGTVKGRELRVLMDGGSSDNFIHPALTKRLAVTVHHAPPFKGELQQLPAKAQFNHLKRLQATDEIAELYTMQVISQDHLIDTLLFFGLN
ncbi:hypothetical protein Ahy_A09g043029 [Arachis hypogaea]|uniref:Retrotransposon gag domain-containing protein n=1 Tax=Arachis hypogaea TaxID=3818 RepID=A0A445BHC0_ARAHY|nr:hypothetical protein Ahy_A09g043029 [Arachis hypogaea]